jgi:hypothetical protein
MIKTPAPSTCASQVQVIEGVEVEDGFLDLSFVHRMDSPQLAAIEVEGR